MIAVVGLLAFMAAGQASPDDCERWGSAELRACEIDRSENDILDAAQSTPAHLMPDGSIRFSSMPALGGEAYVIELRLNRRGGASVRFTWFYGHQGWRWIKEGERRFEITPGAFRELRAAVDDAVSRVRPPPRRSGPDGGETIMVCTDGPGFLTEQVRDGQVITMTGFCPYRRDEEHPHRAIEAAFLDLICPRFRSEFDPNDGIGEDCVRRDRRIRELRR